jgi:hypothetical protein
VFFWLGIFSKNLSDTLYVLEPTEVTPSLGARLYLQRNSKDSLGGTFIYSQRSRLDPTSDPTEEVNMAVLGRIKRFAGAFGAPLTLGLQLAGDNY